MITPKLSLADLVKLVASRAIQDADLDVPDLEALAESHARRLCAEYGVVNVADVDVVVSGARASVSERQKLLDKVRQYPARPVHTERRRRGVRP